MSSESCDSDSDALDDACNAFVLSTSRRKERKRREAANVTHTTERTTRKQRVIEEFPRLPVYDEYPKGDMRRYRWDPLKSPWWKHINRAGVRTPGTRASNKFRRKFRLPIAMVEKLVAEAQGVPAFADKPAGAGNGRGPPRHPLLIKVLAALRCLAKGVDVDDVEEVAQISESSLRTFVPQFFHWLAEEIFPREVRLPTGEHLENSLHVYARLGFPGAYCDTDGVHLGWEACPAKWVPMFRGKEQYPTLAFNVSVLQSTEIIYVASWLPGSKNDKTQAQHDELFGWLRAGLLHPDKTYLLYRADGTVIECKGLYALVDGGYHEWRILQCPLSAAAGDDAAAWSERVESVRKAVECTFGILKKRFKILRRDFNCHTADQISDTFKACCALHNMLLRNDGRDNLGHYPSDWLPGYLARHRAEVLEGDRSRHVVRGPRNVSACKSQREPGHAVLRERLIQHYAQASLRGELAWLKPAAESRTRVRWQEAEGDAGATPSDI
jgi:hypothetical protein